MRPGQKIEKTISKIDMSGIRWLRHTNQTLKCRYKSKYSTWDSTFASAFIVFSSPGKAHTPLSWFPGGELSSMNIQHSYALHLHYVISTIRTFIFTEANTKFQKHNVSQTLPSLSQHAFMILHSVLPSPYNYLCVYGFMFYASTNLHKSDTNLCQYVTNALPNSIRKLTQKL